MSRSTGTNVHNLTASPTPRTSPTVFNAPIGSIKPQKTMKILTSTLARSASGMLPTQYFKVQYFIGFLSIVLLLFGLFVYLKFIR